MRNEVNIKFKDNQMEEVKRVAEENGLRTASFCRMTILQNLKQEAQPTN